MVTFIIFCIGLSVLIIIVNYVLAPKSLYSEKVSAYECGFDPVGTPRSLFDIHFYLVSILFIIFDSEITFLFPWAAFLNNISNVGFLAALLFIIILTAGLVYEWNLGVLRWKGYTS
jgi:NADH-quinone oxidoreductase subunit A